MGSLNKSVEALTFVFLGRGVDLGGVVLSALLKSVWLQSTRHMIQHGITKLWFAPVLCQSVGQSLPDVSAHSQRWL